MMGDASPNPATETQGLPIKQIAPDEVIPTTVYANTFDVNWTLTDATIRFTQIVQIVVPATGETEGRFRPLVSVVMPWWQLKLLRDALADLIDRYETANGELERPTLP
jgi:hypothetical protein